MEVFKVKDIIKTYKGIAKSHETVIAVNNVSLEMQKGEILGILGPNGAGKTTLIKLILGLILPGSGSISVFGKDVTNNKQRETILADVGAVLEGVTNIYHEFTPVENMIYFAGLKGLSKSDVQEQIDYLLDVFDLKEVANKKVRMFSRGMQQKSCIAAALIHNPKLSFLDEPTLGLDVRTKFTIQNWLLKRARENGHSIVITSHDLGFIESVCDRIVIINKGKIIASGKTADLKNKLTDKKIKIVLNRKLAEYELAELRKIGNTEYNFSENIPTLTILLENMHRFYDLVNFLQQSNITVLDIESKQADLEEIFLRIVANG